MGGPRVDDCAIVVPAFNEDATIGRVVATLIRIAPVIVVDDASEDETASRAAASGAVTLSHEQNRGYGGAIDTGFREAVERGFRQAVTVDGDGQHDEEEVGEFVRLLREGDIDLVVGIRPPPRRPLERLCAWYGQRSLGVADPLCGLKGYDLRFYKAYGAFDRHRSVGTELMTYAIRHGARWVQLPITLHGRHDGRSRFYASLRGEVRILRALLAMVRVR